VAIRRAAAIDGNVPACRDDPIEGAAIDDEILDDGKRSGAPRLDRDRVAVPEPPHVELTHRRAAVRTMRNAVHDEAAHAADAFTAIRIERDRVLALPHETFVDDVEHFEKGHAGRDAVGRVVFEPPGRIRARLSPDLQVQSHSSPSPSCLPDLPYL